MQVTKKIVLGVMFLLLAASTFSLAKGGVRESAVAYKTVMQKIASCNMVDRCGTWLMELSIPSKSNKTKSYPEIANALNKSPVFNTYTIVLLDGPFLQKDVRRDLVHFLSYPYQEVPFTTIDEDAVYRFSFARSGQAWATVKILERRVYVYQSAFRDATKDPIKHYIIPQ